MDQLKKIAGQFCDLDTLKYVSKNSRSGKWERIEGALSEAAEQTLFGPAVVADEVTGMETSIVQFDFFGDRKIQAAVDCSNLLMEVKKEFGFEDWPKFKVARCACVRMARTLVMDSNMLGQYRIDVDIWIKAVGAVKQGQFLGVL